MPERAQGQNQFGTLRHHVGVAGGLWEAIQIVQTCSHSIRGRFLFGPTSIEAVARVGGWRHGGGGPEAAPGRQMSRCRPESPPEATWCPRSISWRRSRACRRGAAKVTTERAETAVETDNDPHHDRHPEGLCRSERLRVRLSGTVPPVAPAGISTTVIRSEAARGADAGAVGTGTGR